VLSVTAMSKSLRVHSTPQHGNYWEVLNNAKTGAKLTDFMLTIYQMTTMKRQRTAAILAVVILLTGCTDKDLETVVASLRAVSQGIGTLQQTVISANSSNPKLISDDSTRTILQFCVRLNQTGLELDKVARSIHSTMTIEQRKRMSDILEPIVQTVSTTIVSSGSLDISDDRTRSAVMVSLLALQTSLNAAKLALVR
jgi:hypothetical protein